MRKNKAAVTLLILALLIGCVVPAVAQPNESGSTGFFETERTEGFYTMINEQGEVLQMTALPLYPGDEYIANDNRRYRVTELEGDTAKAEFIGVETTELPQEEAQGASADGAIPTQGKQSKTIAIYHTHTDESYVPSDGASSIYGKGGIFEVGRSLADALKKRGLNVSVSSRTHDPHDQDAYNRSRRTASELLRENPLALIDVHRDAVPPEVYRTKVAGEDVTKVKLVVGRQNPRMNSNLEFAKQIKAAVDKKHPGLIEGIMLAKGDFNQDLSPRSILIEVGAHTNKKDEAVKAVQMLADDIPTVLGVTSPSGAPSATAGEESNAWRTIAMIVGAVLAVGAIFLLISTGSLSGSWDKLKEFSSREWANAFGAKLARKRNHEGSESSKEEKKDPDR